MGRRKRPEVLILEVDTEVREVIAELAESLGWRAVQAATEAEAFALLEGGDWSALLAHAGSVHDAELLWRVRRRHPRVRIVLMTAGSAQPIPSEADALLHKPFSAAQLEAALGERGSPAPSRATRRG
jgi:CheY-like chemotaxis protein